MNKTSFNSDVTYCEIAPTKDDSSKLALYDNQCYRMMDTIQYASPSTALENETSCETIGGVTVVKKMSTGKYCRKVCCSTLIVLMILALIVSLVLLIVAYIRILDLNSELDSLQTSNEIARVTAASCADILVTTPSSPSGYYWIRSTSFTAVRVYCDMTKSCGGVTGGWMRVAELNMTNSSSQCPSGLTEHTDSNIRTCRIASTGASCSSVSIASTGITYSHVCGRIQAYQYGTTDAFYGDQRPKDINIDNNYVDGVSLTHGSPRQHIWTFAAAHDKVDGHPPSNCPCTNANQAIRATPPPEFVGGDYFCDTGSQSEAKIGTFYSEDPLWDGAGCGPDDTCCSFNNPPWFYKQLPAPTTDEIEMRVCRDEDRDNEDIAIEAYEIFVRTP